MKLHFRPQKFQGIFLIHGADFSYIFSGENFGENSAEIFPLKNVGENWNFPQKKFQKIVSPRNSKENSAEIMYKKSASVKDLKITR
jgi:hypothetical protein